MLHIHSFIRLLTLVITLSLVSVPAIETEARPSKNRSAVGKAKKRKARKRTKKKQIKKVTYKRILKWWKNGTSNERIVARAQKAGYVPSKKDIRRLNAKRVSKKLITALKTGESAVKKNRRAAPRNIDIKTIYSEDDMDFDSVPPPKGTPAFVRNKKVEKKRQLDRSLRPSAPFKTAKNADNAKGQKRRAIVAASD